MLRRGKIICTNDSASLQSPTPILDSRSVKNSRFCTVICLRSQQRIAELNTRVVYVTHDPYVFCQLQSRASIPLFVKRSPIMSAARNAPEYKSTDYYSIWLKSRTRSTCATIYERSESRWKICSRYQCRNYVENGFRREKIKIKSLLERKYFSNNLRASSSQLLLRIKKSICIFIIIRRNFLRIKNFNFRLRFIKFFLSKRFLRLIYTNKYYFTNCQEMRIYNWREEERGKLLFASENNSIAICFAVEICQANLDLARHRRRFDFIFGKLPAICKTAGLADILRPIRGDYWKNALDHFVYERRRST